MADRGNNAVDLETARHFLELLFEGVSGLIDVRAIVPDGGTQQRFCVSIDDALERVYAAAWHGWNVYAGVATRRSDKDGKKDNLAATRALWVDYDFKEQDDEAKLKAALDTFPLKPSLQVASGGGRHLYWLLEEPFPVEEDTSVLRLEHVLKGLVDVLDGDRAATDASRILRVPGTTNYPDERKRKRGRTVAPCTLLEETGRIYSFEDFSDFEERGSRLAGTKAPSVHYTSQPWNGETPKAVEKLLEKVGAIRARFDRDTSGLKDTSSSGVDFGLASLLKSQGISAADIEAAIRASRAKGKEQDKPDSYYETTVAKIMASPEAKKGEHPEVERELQTLAAFSPIEYEQVREAAAEKLKIRVGTLDTQVGKRRTTATDSKGSGSAVLFPELEPWPEPVEGAQLLADLESAFRRFLVLPEHGAATMALWVLHSHAHDAACISPLLAFISPEKRCGKTTALDLLRRVVPRAMAVANISTASLFRATEKWQPTLLVDEMDSFLKDNEELRGILNSGHNRATANVIRTVGDDHEPKVFRTWSAKAVALIGSLPSTLEDRSIVICMKRRTQNEKVSRLRGDRGYEFPDLARRCSRWVTDHLQALREADPDLPDSLHDRQMDNWRALAGVAEQAGGPWPERCRGAAKALSEAEEEVTSRVLLLSDLRSIFEERELELWPSQTLVDALTSLTDRPWPEWRRGGKSLTTQGLARLLKPLKIRPVQERTGSTMVRGYRPYDFTDAFLRYIPPAQPVHPVQPNKNSVLDDFTTGTDPALVPVAHSENLNDSRDVPDEPVRNPPKGQKEEGGRPDELEEGLL